MLLYGSGLRLSESLELRIKDIDFGYNQIIVRDSKGEKDRFTMLPQKIIQKNWDVKVVINTIQLNIEK